jgi:precorrin-6B methylase 1
MGEMYRVRDTRLGFEVAVKVVENFSRDPERLRRSRAEARSASALSDLPTVAEREDAGNRENAPHHGSLTG